MLFGEGPQIKNIAADLNKLFRQGSLLNQSGQTVEGDSTADQGTSDLLAARDPVIQEISVGMSGEQSARYTVSGTPPLSLPNSLGKPLKAWEVDVLPYQEGTGDPAPDNVRPIHGTDKLTITTAGKNLLDFNGITQYGITVTKVNGVAHIAGTATTTAYPINFVTTEYPAGTYVWSISELPTGVQCQYTKNGAWAGYVTQGATLTLSEPALIGGYVNVATGTTVDADIRIQLEFGSTASDFTPYIAPSQTVLTLPQTVYTGTIGSEGGESRTAVVTVSDLVWSYNRETFFASIPDKAFGMGNAIICEQYKPSISTGFNLSDYEISVGGSNNYIYIKDPRYTTASEFKAAQGDVKIVYPLAVPTDFSVTAPTIPTPTGTATTWATTEDGTVESMEVTYVGKA